MRPMTSIRPTHGGERRLGEAHQDRSRRTHHADTSPGTLIPVAPGGAYGAKGERVGLRIRSPSPRGEEPRGARLPGLERVQTH